MFFSRAVIGDAVALLTQSTASILTPSAAWIGLYIARAAALGPYFPISSLSEATYPGYARQQVTAYTPVFVTDEGQVAVDGPMMRFQPNALGSAETIAGWFITTAEDVTAGTWEGGNDFAQPIGMIGPDDRIDFVLRVGIPLVASFAEPMYDS